MKQGQDQLKNLITQFKNRFYPYKSIRRFCIPVIGCISSGKSTILNYLLRLKKTLQMADKITTKCVCIIRHKKGCKKAKIYDVEIKERGNYIYNFEKGEEIVNNVAEVIAKKNKDIEEDKVGFDYKKYFLIIEYDIPFFRGDFEKYAELFEFMDIPGLNEVSEKTKSDDEKKTISIENNFYFKQIFPLIQNNIKFALFTFAADTYDKENSLQILKAYIEGGSESKIIQNENNISITNYETNKNEEIKRKAFLDEKQQILFCHKKSFMESIFILNKMDKFEDKEEGKKYFRDFIKKNFQINLNDDNQPCIIGSKLNDGIIKLESFEDYLNFIIFNSDENYKISNFYNYIAEIMNQDFKTNIKIKNEEESNEDSENEEDEEEEEEEEKDEVPSFMKKEEYQKYILSKNNAKQKSYILNFLKPKQYHNLSKIFDKNKYKYIRKKEEDDGLEEMIRLKMKNIIKEHFDIGIYEGMMSKIISDFQIDPTKKNKQLIKYRIENLLKSNQGIGNPKQLIIDFLKYIEKIEQLQKKKNNKEDKESDKVLENKQDIIENEENKNEVKIIDKSEGTISQLKNKYKEITNYFNNTSAIRLLLVGPHNSGKSSILNDIIGYNQRYLPTDLKETTKTGIIIKYIKKGENPKLYETDFETNKSGYNYFKYNDKKPIAEGEKEIFKTINNLNIINSNNLELNFYLLEAPIEFIDLIGISEEEKRKIELIDYPGLDTKFEEAKKMAVNLLKIVDGFIYVFFETSFDDANHQVLTLMYNTIKMRNNFSFDTCLFILNKIDAIKEEINYRDINNRILKIFDDENKFMDSREVLKQKQRIGDESLPLSGFSSYMYNKYRNLNIFNFKEFIRINSMKKEDKGIIKGIKGIYDWWKGDNVIKTIKNNIKNNYLEKKLIKEYKYFNPDPNVINKRLNDLKNIFKDQNVKEEDLEKIVRLYLYILENKTNLNEYKLSKISDLLGGFKQVIRSSFEFFEIKKQNDAINFIAFCYNQILELFNIIKIKVINNENISSFKNIKKEEIINKIRDKKNMIEEKIENEFRHTKNTIYNTIIMCKEESQFIDMVQNHQNLFDEFISIVNKLCNNLDSFLKEEYHNYIKELNLEEMEKNKREFEENMENFNNARLNKMYKSSSSYTSYDIKYFRRWYWPFTKVSSKKYNHEKTISNYKRAMNSFLNEGQLKIEIRINENEKNTINNIEEIYRKFNEEVGGFKDNFDEFQKIVEEIEKFIYMKMGIIG